MKRGLRDPLLTLGLCLLLAGAGAGLRWGLSADAPGWAGAGPWSARPGWLAWLAEAGRQLVWGPGPAWALGLTVVGTPLTVVAVWVRGYILGVAVAAALSAPLNLPQAVLTLLVPHLMGCVAVLLSSREAVRFGAAFMRAAVGIRPHELPAAFARFLAAGAALALLALAAGGVHLLGLSLARLALAVPGPP
ncbi:MAG TPA: hypothetical protein VIL11_05285 [Limnochordales bacterium]